MQRIAFALIALLLSVIPAAAQWEPLVTPSASKLSFYVGAHGAIVNADMDFGAPINLGSNGQAVGGRIGADLTLGQFFVGAFIDADKVMGDLNTLGVDWDASANIRAGANLGKSKLYGIFGAARTFGSGQHLDAWQYGVGTELQLGDSNWSARLEYVRRDYRNVPFGLELEADIVKAGINYKF